MRDEPDVLDRLSTLFEAVERPYERFSQRRDRRVRARKRSAMTLALAITVALVAIGMRVSLKGSPAASHRLRTTTDLNGLIISYPATWSITMSTVPSHDPDRPGRSVLLANFRPRPASNDLCAGLPANGVALSITLVPASYPARPVPSPPPSWPVVLHPADPGPGCVAQRLTASWSAKAGIYRAQVVLAPGAGPADRGAVVAVFDSLRQASGLSVTVQGTVVTSGVAGGEPWSLYASATDPDSGYQGPVLRVGVAGGDGAGWLPVTDGPITGGVALSDATSLKARQSYILGYVPPDVASVVVAPWDAASVQAQLFAVPLQLTNPVRAFVVPLAGAPVGTVTTFDSSGHLLTTAGFALGSACAPSSADVQMSPTLPCRDIHAAGPILTGTTDGTAWRIVEEGAWIIMRDDRGNVLGRVPAQPGRLALAVTHLDAGGMPLAFGVASDPITNVALASSSPGTGGSDTLPQPAFPLADGRIVFVADAFASYDRFDQIVGFNEACGAVTALDLGSSKQVTPAARLCGKQPVLQP